MEGDLSDLPRYVLQAEEGRQVEELLDLVGV
jgi:hypothetical protein